MKSINGTATRTNTRSFFQQGSQYFASFSNHMKIIDSDKKASRQGS
jgi:hypothetical protein